MFFETSPPPPISGAGMPPPPPLREGLDLPLITSILAHWSLTSHVPKYMRKLTKHEGTNIAAAVDLVFLWVLKLGSEGQFSLSLKGFFWAGELRGRGGGVHCYLRLYPALRNRRQWCMYYARSRFKNMSSRLYSFICLYIQYFSKKHFAIAKMEVTL